MEFFVGRVSDVKLKAKINNWWPNLARRGIVALHVREAKRRRSWQLKSGDDFFQGFLALKYGTCPKGPSYYRLFRGLSCDATKSLGCWPSRVTSLQPHAIHANPGLLRTPRNDFQNKNSKTRGARPAHIHRRLRNYPINSNSPTKGRPWCNHSATCHTMETLIDFQPYHSYTPL